MNDSRTWIASILFLDIVGYSKLPIDHQVEIKNHFLQAISKNTEGVAFEESIRIDTGDGMAICSVGDPESMFPVAKDLCHFFFQGDPNFPHDYGVRLGLNLGPIKLVEDINGKKNCLGAGINDAQRVMDFAASNQLLVSESYYEVVSKISNSYAEDLLLLGKRFDKHDKEFMVYSFKHGAQEELQEPSEQPLNASLGEVSDASFEIDSGVEDHLKKQLASCIGSSKADEVFNLCKSKSSSLKDLCDQLSASIERSDDRDSFDQFTKSYGYSGY